MSNSKAYSWVGAMVGGVVGLVVAIMLEGHVRKELMDLHNFVIFLIYWGILLAATFAIPAGIAGLIEGSNRGKSVALLIGGFFTWILLNPEGKGGLITRIYPVNSPTLIIPIFTYIGYIVGKSSGTIADEKAIKHHQYLQTVPGFFDTAKSLSSQANQLFLQKNYPEALQTYENALSHFTRAGEGAKALNNIELANSISNNISALQKNITACKNALGSDIASKARSKFEKGDFTETIQTYEESLKYFQNPELIAKTKTNIESCYIEIDARKVEELSSQAVSLLKEATALNEPFKAIEKLNLANNRLNDAVALATKRKFADALSQLNTISRNIQDQRNIVHERLSNEPVISEKWDVEQLSSKKAPTIQAAEQSNRLKALRESEFFNGFIRLRLFGGQ